MRFENEQQEEEESNPHCSFTHLENARPFANAALSICGAHDLCNMKINAKIYSLVWFFVLVSQFVIYAFGVHVHASNPHAPI